jgi:hypothetical protein
VSLVKLFNIHNLQLVLGMHFLVTTWITRQDRMLRIHRSENDEVVFTLSGQLDEESIAEVETLINSEAKGSRVVLDLRDLTLVNEDAITFLMRCEATITLKNCPPYVREWINAKRRES